MELDNLTNKNSNILESVEPHQFSLFYSDDMFKNVDHEELYRDIDLHEENLLRIGNTIDGGSSSHIYDIESISFNPNLTPANIILRKMINPNYNFRRFIRSAVTHRYIERMNNSIVPKLNVVLWHNIAGAASGYMIMEKLGKDLHNLPADTLVQLYPKVLELARKLRKMRVMHNDFMARNILIGSSGLHIIDFDLSAVYHTNDKNTPMPIYGKCCKVHSVEWGHNFDPYLDEAMFVLSEVCTFRYITDATTGDKVPHESSIYSNYIIKSIYGQKGLPNKIKKAIIRYTVEIPLFQLWFPNELLENVKKFIRLLLDLESETR